MDQAETAEFHQAEERRGHDAPAQGPKLHPVPPNQGHQVQPLVEPVGEAEEGQPTPGKPLVGLFGEDIGHHPQADKGQAIKKENIIIDPGIGFGKTLEHNLEILNRLSEFKKIGRPILVGPSRKSFIGKITGTDPDKRIFGTAASVAIAIKNGADIIRVHDVKEMKQVAMIADAISRRGN